MFLQYFQLKENPFKIASDPAYLYLGRHHEEAMAHLRYAVLEGEGFIAVTGEKGVGKTTVCSSFAENLVENTEVAYICKPASDPQALLRTINAEFGIISETKDIKDLTDSLNAFLMRQKLNGRRVAIFLDDAQSLNRGVLEQVRLISNLETTQDKLLQIILIGEPMLSQRLASQHLRQIGQRVSVGYHIDPLTYDETMAYIQHRLTIASKGAPIRFEPKAVDRIFKYSGGIPRTINVACERALKVAFYQKKKLITGDISKEAISGLAGPSKKAFTGAQRRQMIGWISAAGFLFLVTGVSAYFFTLSSMETPSEKIETKPPPVMTMPETASVSETVSDSPTETAASLLPDNKLEKSNYVEPPELAAEPPEIVSEESDAEPIANSQMTHSVQVGAYRKKKNAEEMVGLLTDKGYRVKIVPVMDTQGTTWLTVRIGDYPTREAAKTEADTFSAREKMDAAVRPFGKF
jgi:general secretion pathway protein A